MAEGIKVLVVDDAALVRKVVADVLVEDGSFEVIAAVSNGKIAMQRVERVEPDVVVLDFEMPEMDGLQTIDALRKRFPRVPIVMFSAITERGARETLEALARGANDYVVKPTKTGDLSEAKNHVRSELLPKLRALVPRSKREPQVLSQANNKIVSLPRLPSQEISAIAIGVSTGGPNALAEVIPLLPVDFGVPVFITQHMPAMFTRMLAERLTQRGKLPVHEATDGMLVQAGQVYLAPGGWHLEVRRRGSDLVTKLTDAAPENSCRPSVDVMLRSLVDIYGSNLLTTILTGMGIDGKAGCDLAVKAGGTVLAQDEASSVVWGMPGAVVAAGLAHQILALPEIAPRIIELVQRGSNSKDGRQPSLGGGKS